MSAKKAEIGKMRRRLTIEEVVETPDGQGGVSISYRKVATVWAEVKTKDRSERWFSDQVQPVGTHEIIIRHLPCLKETMKLSLKEYDVTRTFQIKGIEWVDDRRFFVSLSCQENVGS